MTANRELLTQIPDLNLSLTERVNFRCQLAKQLEKTGALDAARALYVEALSQLDDRDGDLKALGTGAEHYSKPAEALITHGVVLARLSRHEEARNDFERAMSTAEQIQDLQTAGLAALSFIEELGDLMSEDELCSVMDRARMNLQDTQDPLVLNRLSKCACLVLSIIHSARPDWSTFSLTETLRRHEGRFIQMALEDAGGSVTKAASLLGLPGHQSLNFILQNRHRDLLNARTPIKPRRRRLFKLVNPQKQLEDTSKE